MNKLIDKETAGYITAVCIAIVWMFLFNLREKVYEREAVQRGHAEYILNPKDGSSTFTWRTNCICK